VPVPFPQSEGAENIFQPPLAGAEMEFAENFTTLQGRFSFCLDEVELVEQLKQLIAARTWTKIYCRESALKQVLATAGFGIEYSNELINCDASITGCEALIARTGSIVMSSGQQSGRTTSVYAPVHICIAYATQLKYDVKDGLLLVKKKYEKLPSLITLATGPSRTADIEKTLVVGVHGPKEVFCFLVDKG